LTALDPLPRFEQIARRVHSFTDAQLTVVATEQHPFDLRSIHPDLPEKVLHLFDDGHFAEAAFAAFKFIESEVKRISKIKVKTGFGLMMDAFNEGKPALALNPLMTDSDEDEQRGYRHIFAGAIALRRLDDAGLR
jgi:uncharacterized protein (TIGR02391 family)